jgi:hypothetical protein
MSETAPGGGREERVQAQGQRFEVGGGLVWVEWMSDTAPGGGEGEGGGSSTGVSSLTFGWMGARPVGGSWRMCAAASAGGAAERGARAGAPPRRLTGARRAEDGAALRARAHDGASKLALALREEWGGWRVGHVGRSAQELFPAPRAVPCSWHRHGKRRTGAQAGGGVGLHLEPVHAGDEDLVVGVWGGIGGRVGGWGTGRNGVPRTRACLGPGLPRTFHAQRQPTPTHPSPPPPRPRSRGSHSARGWPRRGSRTCAQQQPHPTPPHSTPPQPTPTPPSPPKSRGSLGLRLGTVRE